MSRSRKKNPFLEYGSHRKSFHKDKRWERRTFRADTRQAIHYLAEIFPIWGKHYAWYTGYRAYYEDAFKESENTIPHFALRK